LSDSQEQTLRTIRDRSEPVLEAMTDAAGPEARPTEKWVGVVEFVFEAALVCLAIGAEGDRATLLEAETQAINSVRALDSATIALLEGDQHRFVGLMRAAEDSLAR
jgi:hypothetical protein